MYIYKVTSTWKVVSKYMCLCFSCALHSALLHHSCSFVHGYVLLFCKYWFSVAIWLCLLFCTCRSITEEVLCTSMNLKILKSFHRRYKSCAVLENAFDISLKWFHSLKSICNCCNVSYRLVMILHTDMIVMMNLATCIKCATYKMKLELQVVHKEPLAVMLFAWLDSIVAHSAVIRHSLMYKYHCLYDVYFAEMKTWVQG